jgi:hypothetical protein
MSSVAVPTYLRLAATGAGLLIAVGCGPTISSDRDSTIPIPAGATVEFDGGAVEGANQLNPAVANDIIHRRIQLAIMQQLQQKGYKIVDSSEVATFRVQYFVGVKHSTDYVTTTTGYSTPYYGPWGYGYGWGYGPGYGGWGGTAVTTTQPVTTTNASFVADLVEEKSGHTAWQGIWQGQPGPNPPSQEQINTAMAKVFKTLPKVP